MSAKTDAYEKLGVFYLGRPYDPETGRDRGRAGALRLERPVYPRRLRRMTGSGKTGLCVTLLEEAAIDGIPALVIDVKGDLGNLLLTFPDLAPEDFRPGSTRPRPAARASMPTSSPAARPICGRTASPSGTRTASASASCASRRTSPSTRRAARPACRFRSCRRSPRRPRSWRPTAT